MDAPTSAPVDEASTGELLSRLTADLSTLVRDELRLAQVETTAKAKRAGVGLGLFGGAGLFAVFGLGALVAAAILGLATAVDAWLAAIIVAVALFVIAAAAALVGKRDVAAAVPPVPTEAIHGLKTDVDTLRDGVHR